MNRYISNAICYVMLLIAATGPSACKKADDDPTVNKTRTVLVYMLAENNLSPNATGTGYQNGNIDEMTEGMTSSLASRHNLIVYVDPAGRPPVLLRITENGRDTIRVYEEQNSISPAVMRGVINEVLLRYPADSYGLVLWSHGNGWLPGSADGRYLTKSDVSAAPMAFGVENNNEWMEISELKEALPDHVFNYIVFDACQMASVEVCYELKEKANWIIASAIEILAHGFPYVSETPLFFHKQAPIEIAKCFFNFYNQQTGNNQSGGIGVIRTSALDLLADRFSALIADRAGAVAGFDADKVQRFDRPSKVERPNHFDLADFAGAISTDAALLQQFSQALDETVIYKACTPFLLNNLQINTYCGLSTYIPLSAYSDLNIAYKQTAWSKATDFGR